VGFIDVAPRVSTVAQKSQTKLKAFGESLF